MAILYFKSLHIIFIVAWFAGLFFMGRMLIYQQEAIEKGSDDNFELTKAGAKRVWYIITLPSMILTYVFGLALAGHLAAFTQGWFHMKFTIVILFTIYNLYINRLRKRLIKKLSIHTGIKLRLLNEVPFFFLIAIVFTVYFKDIYSGLWASTAVIGLGAIGGFFAFLKRRNKN